MKMTKKRNSFNATSAFSGLARLKILFLFKPHVDRGLPKRMGNSLFVNVKSWLLDKIYQSIK